MHRSIIFFCKRWREINIAWHNIALFFCITQHNCSFISFIKGCLHEIVQKETAINSHPHLRGRDSWLSTGLVLCEFSSMLIPSATKANNDNKSWSVMGCIINRLWNSEIRFHNTLNWKPAPSMTKNSIVCDKKHEQKCLYFWECDQKHFYSVKFEV